MTNYVVSATRVASRAAPSLGGEMGARWVRASALVLLVAVPLVANPFGPDAYAAVKVQVLYGLTVLMLCAWAVSSAISAGASWRVTTPELAVWVFWLAVLVSSLTSSNLRLSIFGGPGRHEGVLAVTAYLAIFFAGAQFFGTASGVRRLGVAAGIGASAAIAYGFAQTVLPPLFDGETMIRSWYGSTGLLRIFSTLGSPVVFGGYLATIIPLLLALAFRTPRTRVSWLGVAIAGYIAAMATYTRAAWLGLAVATGVFFLLGGRQIWQQHRRALLAGAVALAAVVMFLLPVLGGSAPVVERAASALTVHAGSGRQRIYIWEQTLHLIQQRPLLGWGLETLREVFPYDRPSLEKHFGLRPVIIDKAHNDVLQVAVSVGLPGAAAYVTIWVIVLVATYRLWWRTEGGDRVLAAGCLAAFVGYLVQAQFSFSTVALAPLAWVLAGAVSGWEATMDRDAIGRNKTQHDATRRNDNGE